ncbi:hypothetical protein PAEAM_38980 [Paenibacillus sp. GM1FR]|nr:hypothetical protein [Paenibacillus sp. GM1FR]PJN57791.1 hypothetical protein PAEAM_38980 [Paenibacillus sp. GM1FR]
MTESIKPQKVELHSQHEILTSNREKKRKYGQNISTYKKNEQAD